MCMNINGCVSYNFCHKRICELNKKLVHDIGVSIEYTEDCDYVGVYVEKTNCLESSTVTSTPESSDYEGLDAPSSRVLPSYAGW